VITVTEIERVLGGLGETPYDSLREEKDEDVTGESSMDKQFSMLNETLIHFFRESGSRNGASASSFGNASKCQLCQVEDHTTVACQKHNDMRPKCSKCGGGHRAKNYGIRCSSTMVWDTQRITIGGRKTLSLLTLLLITLRCW